MKLAHREVKYFVCVRQRRIVHKCFLLLQPSLVRISKQTRSNPAIAFHGITASAFSM